MFDSNMTNKDREEVDDLQQRVRVLEDKVRALVKSDEEQKRKAATNTSMTVAAIEKAMLKGHWIVIQNALFKQSDRLEPGAVDLVSDCERIDAGVFWERIRCMTDKELKEIHGVERAGICRKAPPGSCTAEAMERANKRYLSGLSPPVTLNEWRAKNKGK